MAVPFLVLAPANTLWFVRFNSLRSQKDSIWEIPMKILGTSVVSNHVVNIGIARRGDRRHGLRGLDGVAHTHPPTVRAMTLATAMVMIVWMAVNKIWNPQYVLWVFAVGSPGRHARPASVSPSAPCPCYDFAFEFVLRRPDDAQLVHRGSAGCSVLARTVLYVSDGQVDGGPVAPHRRLRRPAPPPVADERPRSTANDHHADDHHAMTTTREAPSDRSSGTRTHPSRPRPAAGRHPMAREPTGAWSSCCCIPFVVFGVPELFGWVFLDGDNFLQNFPMRVLVGPGPPALGAAAVEPVPVQRDAAARGLQRRVPRTRPPG